MPYFAKSVFLTLSYLILMTGIADSKMFFVSLLIFVGGVLFDLYFSYATVGNIGENWAVSVIKLIICVLAVIAIGGLLISVLGICDMILVTDIKDTKYIIFRNNELREVLSPFKFKEFKFCHLLTILSVEIVSCLPDFLIHRIEIKVKNKKNKSEKELKK